MNLIDYKKIKKVLIIRIGKIGDIIISSFVFRSIKEENPEIKIELITLKKNKDVLRFNPFLDKIYFINKNIFSLTKILPLRFNDYDLIIDLNDNPSTTSSILLFLLRAKKKLGFNFEKQKKYLTHAIDYPDKNKTHLVERYAHILQSSGLKLNPEIIKPELFVDSQIDLYIKEKLSGIKSNHKIVAINISAGAEIRKYPAVRWIELINSLITKYSHLKFLVLSDPGDKNEFELIIQSIDKNYLINAEGSTFQHFACKIKNSDLLITPDTSAVHIASAFQVPVIALYPNVDWNFVSFAPYRTKFRSIRSSDEEIKNISVTEIVTEFESLIQEINW